MKIIETGIPDVDLTNIDEAKVELADEVIQSVYPILDEVYSEKQIQIKKLKTELIERREKVQVLKSEIDSLMKTYRRRKIERELLKHVSTMVSSGLVHDGNLRHETVVLLKVSHNLSDDKLNHHIKRVRKTISNRFPG